MIVRSEQRVQRALARPTLGVAPVHELVAVSPPSPARAARLHEPNHRARDCPGGTTISRFSNALAKAAHAHLMNGDAAGCLECVKVVRASRMSYEAGCRDF